VNQPKNLEPRGSNNTALSLGEGGKPLEGIKSAGRKNKGEQKETELPDRQHLLSNFYCKLNIVVLMQPATNAQFFHFGTKMATLVDNGVGGKNIFHLMVL
jgi:hypothetical protein